MAKKELRNRDNWQTASGPAVWQALLKRVYTKYLKKLSKIPFIKFHIILKI